MQVGPWSQTRDVPRIQMRIQSLKPVGRTIFTVYTEAILLEKNTIVARVCFSLKKGSEAYASLSKHCSWNRGGARGDSAGRQNMFVRAFPPFWTFCFSFEAKKGSFYFSADSYSCGRGVFGRFLVVRGKCCTFLSGRCGGFLSFSIRTLWWIFASTLRIRGFWEGVERSPVGPFTF